MRYYGISEGRVKRIIRFPARSEEGVIEGAVAVMQPTGTKQHQEIWVMYKLEKTTPISKITNFNLSDKKIKVITAWRYPGKSKTRDPIPQEIIREIQSLL
jgi:hypothetical protein